MGVGFEPTRAEHNGLAVHRLNHSAIPPYIKQLLTYIAIDSTTDIPLHSKAITLYLEADEKEIPS